MRDACNDERDKAIVELMISAGMRYSEIRCLKVVDLDFENKSVLIHGKGSKERIGYLTVRCVRALRFYLENRKQESEFVFCNTRKCDGSYNGLSKGGVEDIVKKIGKKAGLVRVVIHFFRHYFCSELCRRGMNLFYIQDLMGHASIETTKRVYTHICQYSVKAEHDKFCA